MKTGDFNWPLRLRFAGVRHQPVGETVNSGPPNRGQARRHPSCEHGGYPSAKTVAAYVKVNPDTVSLEDGFTRDVRKIGHFGTGDLEITMRSLDDLAKAQPLFQRAYEGG